MKTDHESQIHSSTFNILVTRILNDLWMQYSSYYKSATSALFAGEVVIFKIIRKPIHEDSAELYMFDIFSVVLVSLSVHPCKIANKTKPVFLMKLADA